MKTETIPIKGMHCKSCARLIENKVKALDGVKEVSASFPKANATVTFDPKTVSLEQIGAEIQKLGYAPNHPGISKIVVKDKTFVEGLIYGLVPHIGCIGFIVFSILGVTAATSFFRPLLLDPNFFYMLIALSFVFATASAIIYMRKNEILSIDGILSKKKYLAVLYGTTMGVNLFLFMLIFPIVANMSSGDVSITGALTSTFASSAQVTDGDSLTLGVSIPCPGHAPLISGELKTIVGVESVIYRFPNLFDVVYDSEQTSKQEILGLEVFGTYPAEVVSENTPLQSVITSAQPKAPAGAAGSCGRSSCTNNACTGGCGGGCSS